MRSIFNSVASCNNAFAFRYICCPRISGKIRPRTSFSRGVCLACAVRLTGSRSNQEGPTFNPIACWYRWFCGICVGSPMARMARPARGRAGTRTCKSRSGGPPGVFMFLSPRRCAHNPMQYSSPMPTISSPPHFSSICLCATMVRPSVVLGDQTMLDRRHLHVQL